jgi:A/G-specific adenine glycosylase
MLQQTRVATVIPFYRRFLRTFPTVQSLARVRRERVLKLWSGLGYYRRARNLHEAAKIIVCRLGGKFPRDYRQARSLPGVGDYTARAVLSIAYNLPYAVLDGNVARVLARLRARKGNLSQPAFRRRVENDLARLLSRRRPGDFNQALMELGQTVCLPKAPRCASCPIRHWCRAFAQENPESYPVARPRRPTETRYLAAAVFRRHGQVALARGLEEGLVGDLWNFPGAFGRSRSEARARMQASLRETLGDGVQWGERLGGLRHAITYRAIHVDLYAADLVPHCHLNSLRWFPLPSLPRAAVSQLARKIAHKLREDTRDERIETDR